MAWFVYWLVALFVASLVVSQNAPSICGSFTVNGADNAVFSYYRFYDFRTLSGPIAITPPGPRGSLAVSKNISDSSWTSDWNIRVQADDPITAGSPALYYVAQNVVVGNASSQSFLTLTTNRLSNSTQNSAEIDYVEKNVTAISLRVLARVQGSPGAVAGFFTYHDDTSESDIEVLTRDPPVYALFSNQPTTDNDGNPIPGASLNVSMPQSTTNWNVYRLDLLPDKSIWFFNGAQVATTRVNVPKDASMVIINMWSDGGSFSGRMDVGQSATLDVAWIEMAFNTSSPPATSNGTRCSLDASGGSAPRSESPLRPEISEMLLWSQVLLLISVVCLA